MHRFLVGLALALAVATCPALARAATASVARTTLTYEAGLGEANRVVLTQGPNVYRLVDPGATIDAGAGCRAVTPSQVECQATRTRAIELRLGDRGDFATASIVTHLIVRAGAGNNEIEGGLGDDDLFGDAGQDRLEGGVGFDILDGGAGRDVLSGGTGGTLELIFSDVLGEEGDGGEAPPELDLVRYSRRTNAVTVRLDRLANDGEAGEADHVLGDVEGAIGGRGDDTLIGNDRGANVLVGGGGGDTLRGRGGLFDALLGQTGDDAIAGHAREQVVFAGPGDDDVTTGAGLDVLFAGPGDDHASAGGGGDALAGSAGRDMLRAGGGADLLVGGADRDVLLAGAGRDRVSARDRAQDVIDGGSARDTASVDRRLDRVRRVEALLPSRRRPPALAGRTKVLAHAARPLLHILGSGAETRSS